MSRNPAIDGERDGKRTISGASQQTIATRSPKPGGVPYEEAEHGVPLAQGKAAAHRRATVGL